MKMERRAPREFNDAQRFWFYLGKHPKNECWPWTRAKCNGYGMMWSKSKGKSVRVHRFAYEEIVGVIPPGLTIDHVCRNRSCCNPEHLEPVSNKENTLRGEGVTAINARKTHCIHGHSLDEDNVFITSKNYRYCRTCGRDAMTRYLRKRSAV